MAIRHLRRSRKPDPYLKTVREKARKPETFDLPPLSEQTVIELKEQVILLEKAGSKLTSVIYDYHCGKETIDEEIARLRDPKVDELEEEKAMFDDKIDRADKSSVQHIKNIHLIKEILRLHGHDYPDVVY